MKSRLLNFALLLATLTCWSQFAQSKSLTYSEILCQDPRFACVEIQEGETWETLWPDAGQRDLVRRLNRLNIKLKAGMPLALPKDITQARLEDFSPFPAQIEASGEKEVHVDLSQLAWAAYNAEGKQVKWGPASGGKAWCPDVKQKCRSRAGEFSLERKGGENCISKKFPIPTGGAPMPYCMYYYNGYALHGSPGGLPGYNASHGCVRLYTEDARWLNEEFVEIKAEGDLMVGTTIKVLSNDDPLLPFGAVDLRRAMIPRQDRPGGPLCAEHEKR